jgi:hypothetical protein
LYKETVNGFQMRKYDCSNACPRSARSDEERRHGGCDGRGRQVSPAGLSESLGGVMTQWAVEAMCPVRDVARTSDEALAGVKGCCSGSMRLNQDRAHMLELER